jgi:hypothetical protein
MYYVEINVKKLFLCLINKAPSNEDVLGSGDIAAQFLTSALDGGK